MGTNPHTLSTRKNEPQQSTVDYATVDSRRIAGSVSSSSLILLILLLCRHLKPAHPVCLYGLHLVCFSRCLVCQIVDERVCVSLSS